MNRAERRRHDRLISRAHDAFDKHGCARCHSMPYHGVHPVLRDGTAICSSCLRPGDTPIFMMALYHKNPGIEDDKGYFAVHPNAEYRVRHPVDGEIQELVAKNYALGTMAGATHMRVLPDCDTILTFQHAPGERTRMPIRIRGLDAVKQQEVIDSAISYIKRAHANSRPLMETMGRRNRAVLEYASTVLSVDAAVGGGKLMSELQAQGDAMLEKRNSSVN